MRIKNYWRKYIAAFSSAAMLSTTIFGGGVAVFGAPFSPATTDVKSERETRNETLSEFAATQGMVLLQNNDNALPVAAGETVALFGGGAVITIKGGG